MRAEDGDGAMSKMKWAYLAAFLASLTGGLLTLDPGLAFFASMFFLATLFGE